MNIASGLSHSSTPNHRGAATARFFWSLSSRLSRSDKQMITGTVPGLTYVARSVGGSSANDFAMCKLTNRIHGNRQTLDYCVIEPGHPHCPNPNLPRTKARAGSNYCFSRVCQRWPGSVFSCRKSPLESVARTAMNPTIRLSLEH